MFKDKDQELARLEAELLKVDEEAGEEEYEEEYEEAYEEEYEEEYEEAAEETALPEYYYQDTRAAQGPAVYQNYSNDYGKNLRNYASGYQAYNSDTTDEDLDAYSEDVYEEEPAPRSSGLLAVACALVTLVAVAALLMLLWYRGVI